MSTSQNEMIEAFTTTVSLLRPLPQGILLYIIDIGMWHPRGYGFWRGSMFSAKHFEFPNFHSAWHHSGNLGRGVWLKKSYLDLQHFKQYKHFKQLVENVFMRMLICLQAKRQHFYRKSEKLMSLLISGRHQYWCLMLVHPHGVPIQSSINLG